MMKDISQIPYLLQLSEADSSQIQATVFEELLSYCPILEEAISLLGVDLTPKQQYLVHEVNRQFNQDLIEEKWLHILEVSDQAFKLENGLDFIGQLQSQETAYRPASWLLDRLAIEFRQRYRRRDPIELARFLFKVKKLTGYADDDGDPRHHNLSYIAQKRKGSPIILTCIYMLVGWRLGLKIQGCDLPGRFLARAYFDGQDILVDCYRGGKILDQNEVAALCLAPSIRFRRLLRQPPSADTVLKRILSHLAIAYLDLGQTAQTQTIERLLATTDQYLDPNNSSAIFEPGQLVQHSRYGYRGVIVDYDSSCRADDSWYQANQTQPAKDQPWYHVLVHGTNYSTYAAESSLNAYSSSEKLVHPLIPLYFRGYENGSYRRNDKPWLPKHH